MKLERTDCFPKPWHPNYPESRNQTEEPESQCAHLSLKELRLLTSKKGKGGQSSRKIQNTTHATQDQSTQAPR